MANGEKSRFAGVGVAIMEIKPKIFVLLAPAYFSEKDDVNTISPGALKIYSELSEATHEPLEHLNLKTKKGQEVKIPVDTVSGLDYVKLKLHHFQQPLRTKTERHPIVTVKPKLIYRSAISNDTAKILQPTISALDTTDRGYLLAMYYHIKFGHQNMDYVRKCARSGRYKGMPKNLPDLKYGCPLCKITAFQRIPRGDLKDTTELRKGARFHADFMIFKTESIRLFTSALLIVEAKTRKRWGFPTRSRNPPLQQVKWLVKHLRAQGYSFVELRVDEDGALAQSSEFMGMCTAELHIAVQTTGGYNSEANGMVESPIKPVKRMMRAMIVGAGFGDEMWCFSFQYALYVLDRSYHRMLDDMPLAKWNDGNWEYNVRDLLIFGSKVYILTKPQLKKQLQVRSKKDPRDYYEVDDEDMPAHVDGFFVGYASHENVLLVYDPESNKVLRAHHAGVDEYNVRTLNGEKMSLNTVLLQDLPPPIQNTNGDIDPSKIRLVSCDLAEAPHKLDPNKCATITVSLPPATSGVGLQFDDDTVFGFPLLTKIRHNSILRTQIPVDMHKNCWLVAINSSHGGYAEPITGQFALEELKRHQKKRSRAQVELTFHRKIRPIITPYETYRATHDQAVPAPPIVRHIVALPEKPVSKKTIFDNLKGNQRRHWVAGLKHQYSKNAQMLLLSTPVPREKLPPDVKVFPSIIACRVKEKGKDLYKFETRHCVNGSSMEQGTHFDFSRSPTISYTGLRFLIVVAAAFGLRLSIIDVTNCFQNDAIPPEKRIFIILPPVYLEWFQEQFPHIKLEKSKDNRYVIQTINGMQGRKDAGHNWYLLLREILIDYGMKPCPSEPALFVFFEGTETMMVITSTDDFLVAYSHVALFTSLQDHLKQFVPITAEDGTILKYLNVRIIQSDLGISMDQTHHIKTNVLNRWYPKGTTEMFKSADTPYRTDSEFEKALETQLPATGSELTALETKYNGKYNALVGEFLHVAGVTRFDLGFSMSRLGQYATAPNTAAFQGLARVARFLATHLHTPIFYPRRKFTVYDTIRFETEPGKYLEQVVPGFLTIFTDADHARDTRTRRSISCIFACILGVAADWHIGKQSCMAKDSTDAELRAFFTGMIKNRYYRPVLEWMKCPLPGPTTIFEDNQPAIDVMKSGQISGRVKHMAVPIAMIHEDIKNENSIPKKIPGTINPSDLGTKPLPGSSLHRHSRWLRGQRFYPAPNTEHGRLLQVEMVNQRLTEFDSAVPGGKFDFAMNSDYAAYDQKGST